MFISLGNFRGCGHEHVLSSSYASLRLYGRQATCPMICSRWLETCKGMTRLESLSLLTVQAPRRPVVCPMLDLHTEGFLAQMKMSSECNSYKLYQKLYTWNLIEQDHPGAQPGQIQDARY
jgi:hypothetical protein